jgi:hypothetical protein
LQERAIACSSAAEPDIESMRGRDQHSASGGMSTGLGQCVGER